MYLHQNDVFLVLLYKNCNQSANLYPQVWYRLCHISPIQCASEGTHFYFFTNNSKTNYTIYLHHLPNLQLRNASVICFYTKMLYLYFHYTKIAIKVQIYTQKYGIGFVIFNLYNAHHYGHFFLLFYP